jgi:hypothetical protein
MNSVSRDVTTEDRELLSEADAPDLQPLGPVEMGRADRETKGGIFGTFYDGFGGIHP